MKMGRGAMKVCVSGAGQPEPSIQDQIGELIGKAEAHTQQACIVSGQSGKLDHQEAYVLVLCAEHAHQRQLGTLPDF
jgi:hypothetical protein